MSQHNDQRMHHAEQPGRRILWLPWDDTELGELLAAGWRETARCEFGALVRVEIVEGQPPAPEPADDLGHRKRNRKHAGPRAAFKKSSAVCWTDPIGDK